MTEIGPDRGQPPPWPPVSPALPPATPPPSAAEAVAVDTPPPPPVPAAAGPVPTRNLTRLAILGAVTLVLLVAALLITTPAHRPASSATLPTPAPAPLSPGAAGSSAGASAGGGAQSAPAGTASAAGRPGTSASPGVPGQPGGAPTPQPTSAAPPGALSATMSVNVHGAAGYQATVTVTNQSDLSVSGWQLVITLPAGETVTKADGATYVQAGSVVTLTPKDPKQALHPKQKVPVKFEVRGDTAEPTGCAVNGNPCG